MINVRKLVKISRIADTSSGGLAMMFKRNTLTNTVSRTKLYKEEEKLQKLREDTFSALSKTLGEKGKKGGLTTLLGVLGIGGTGRVVRRFGGGGGGLRGGSGAPKLPRGPLAKSLSKFGRIGPLALASTGLDFFSRKQSGQSNLQAGGGALAGLGGFAGGAKLGAMLGTAIMPGPGTAVGGLLGGAVGGLMGGNIFDRLYGQNTLGAGADLRRIQELERTRQGKTLFGENLDKFDVVLDKFEATSTKSKFDPAFEEVVGSISAMLFGISPKKKVSTQTPAFMRLIDTLFNAAVVVVPQAKPLQLTWKQVARNLIVSKKSRKASGFLKFSQDASKIKPQTLLERMANSPFMTKRGTIIPGQKGAPGISKKGITVRQNSLFKKNFDKMFKKNPEFQFMDFLKSSKLHSPDKLRIDLNKVYKSNYNNIMESYNKIKNPTRLDEVRMLEKVDKLRKVYETKILEITRYGDEVRALFNELKGNQVLNKIKPSAEGSEVMTGGIMKQFRVIKKKYSNINQSATISNEKGGIMSGPETGYLAVLHGRERIIPEENRYTRSRGQSQGMKQNIFIFQDSNNNTQPQQSIQTPKAQMVPIIVEANPFDVATKYSELIAKVTV
ncbi:MAG: hypothetical protein CMB76_08705 [Euryarchaeota archaeon]|nr:hypothetical protein [Euryarchaeota archaeon]|tara:strand:- start:1408 stop:3243 length:1836 start_codon:yes stop_codon:yes gene_type:complete